MKLKINGKLHNCQNGSEDKSIKRPDQLSRFLVFQSMDKLKNNQTEEAVSY